MRAEQQQAGVYFLTWVRWEVRPRDWTGPGPITGRPANITSREKRCPALDNQLSFNPINLEPGPLFPCISVQQSWPAAELFCSWLQFLSPLLYIMNTEQTELPTDWGTGLSQQNSINWFTDTDWLLEYKVSSLRNEKYCCCCECKADNTPLDSETLRCPFDVCRPLLQTILPGGQETSGQRGYR